MKKKNPKLAGVGAVFFAVLLFALFYPVSSWIVFDRIQSVCKTPVQGRFEAHFFSPTFRVKNAVLNWNKKVGIESGDIEVRYELGTLLKNKALRVEIRGRKVPVRFLGAFSRISPREKVILDEFYADLLIGREGLQEISSIRIESPELKFQLGSQS
ncbi:MAG: hypothetical protein FGM27_01700 [Candidatus Omnitrophica bacterium]|nr:hypothetical protein [Candidatus Omnitrophota bacterium]